MIVLPDFAILGKAGSGKDTLAEVLMERFADLNYRRFALADPLKDVAADLWGDEARKDRGKLQPLGVAVRDIELDTWVGLLMSRVFAARETEPALNVVVTDCRFLNELRAFREAGYRTIRVEADRALRIDRLRANGKLQDEDDLDHVSETELDDHAVDYTITNNGTRDELVYQLCDVLNGCRL